MKLIAADLLVLKTRAFIALVMIALGAAAVYWSSEAGAQARKALAVAQGERNEAERKLRRVRSEEDDIRRKSALFDALKAKGAVGEEQRLDWVELVKEIRAQRQIAALHYEFAPQRALDDKAGAAGNVRFYASEMKLQMLLLHEEDLTRVLADLRDRARALILVKSCQLARVAPAAHEARAALRSDCLIDWVTLRETAGERR
jgi:hypothetical protein